MVLIGLLGIVISLFGSDALSGGSQVALLMGLAVCVFISMVFYRVPWQAFEQQIAKTLGGVAVTILILLAVGMLAGSWMVSGIVPTLIYYGVQLLSPQLFLLCACVICALVSLLSGSSWTTIATIGVALLGISHALGINEAVAAGAIISGLGCGIVGKGNIATRATTLADEPRHSNMHVSRQHFAIRHSLFECTIDLISIEFHTFRRYPEEIRSRLPYVVGRLHTLRSRQCRHRSISSRIHNLSAGNGSNNPS